MRREDVWVTHHNAPLELINAIANVYVRDLEKRPSVFTGSISGFVAPPGVEMWQDALGAWVMRRANVDPMAGLPDGFAGDDAAERAVMGED